MFDLNKLKQATFGAEIEVANIDTSKRLSVGNKWCFKDGTICNSNGTANDPLKRFNRFGSEILVKPSDSPKGLLKTVLKIYRTLDVDDTCFNYTTNLHVHIKVPGLSDDLKALKRIIKYLNIYGEELYNLIDPVPVPDRSKCKSDKIYDMHMKRYKRRFRSHRHIIKGMTYDRMMAAKTVKEFYEGHASKDKSGKLIWHFVLRAGVNLKRLWDDTGTIEFRHFTLSP